jgi:hypothetical protein
MGTRHASDAALPDSFDSRPSAFSDAESVRTEPRFRAQLPASDDDLVSVLALATENVRARQVYEWERQRRASAAW